MRMMFEALLAESPGALLTSSPESKHQTEVGTINKLVPVDVSNAIRACTSPAGEHQAKVPPINHKVTVQIRAIVTPCGTYDVSAFIGVRQ